ncbi:general secretion pathway protein GspB [Marinobacter subterrani]|uniref:general secretion pathway protein GspB n=1 Tax=Marinobacter subterrani TaxID=1658765 RepID=UPI00235262C0|nr:general secretion pathway protein GspB [Marinobacter subterrani]
MSYILDALRKSEAERRQGRVPDLGQQVQLIHRPKKKKMSPVIWIVGALMLNAGVLAFVFWPGVRPPAQPVQPAEMPLAGEPEPERKAGSKEPEATAVVAESAPDQPVAETGDPVPAPERQAEANPLTAPAPRQQATIIVPSADSPPTFAPLPALEQAGRVPHLVELPLSFQKSVPDLTFNSHIYSSSPSSRRVMINNGYLRIGDSVDGLRVEDITEEGVVLSLDGQRFRVGVVRNWVSPR